MFTYAPLVVPVKNLSKTLFLCSLKMSHLRLQQQAREAKVLAEQETMRTTPSSPQTFAPAHKINHLNLSHEVSDDQECNFLRENGRPSSFPPASLPGPHKIIKRRPDKFIKERCFFQHILRKEPSLFFGKISVNICANICDISRIALKIS